jgi:hypothetical protein
MPEVSTVHIDRALTNVSIQYPIGNLISNVLFPDISVQKKSDKYFIYDALRRDIAKMNTKRAPGAKAQETDFNVTTGNYSCDDHALSAIVPDEERENADAPLAPDIDKTEFLVRQLLTDQELDAKTKLDAGITATAAITNKWSNQQTGDPYDDIKNAILAVEDAIGTRPNTMALDSKVFEALINHPNILERFKYTGTTTDPSLASPKTIAEMFQLDLVVVARAFQNIAAEGQAKSITRIWDTTTYLGFVAPRVGLKVATLAGRMCWAPFQGSVNGWMIEKWREFKRKGDMIQASKYYDQHVIMADAGYRLTGCI